jgi:hypothetical protein
MEFASLKVQLEAARRIEATIDGALFDLRLPSDHAWRVAVESNRDAAGRVLETRAMRALLDAALVGWQKVTAKHFAADQPEEAVAFSPAARSELLDVRQDIADELVYALAEKRRERRAKMEEGRKN